jgi:hypothetical protein
MIGKEEGRGMPQAPHDRTGERLMADLRAFATSLELSGPEDAPPRTNTIVTTTIEGAKDPYPEESNPKDLLGTKKCPIQLVPPALRIVAAPALADGARKYGPYNWRSKPVKLSVYLAALWRHIDGYWDGEELTEDSQTFHLSNAIACLAIIVDAMGIGNLIDDRPPAGPAPKLLKEQDNSAGIRVERVTLNDALAQTEAEPDFNDATPDDGALPWFADPEE